jgi:hypothetical protein
MNVRRHAVQTKCDQFLLEGCLQVRSIWTLGIVLVLVAVLAFASVSSLGSGRAMSRGLATVQRSQGSSFSSWLARDPQAAPYRDELANLQPGMGAGAYLAIFGVLGPLIAAVWGARAIGTEFAAGTVRVRAAQDGWARSVAVKYSVVIVIVLLATLAVTVLGAIAGRAVWHVFSSEVPAVSSLPVHGQTYSPVLAALVVATGVTFYGLLASFIALLTRSTAAAIVAGLTIPFAEGFARQWWLPHAAYGYLLSRVLVYNETSLMSRPLVPRPPDTALVACGVLAAWLLAVLAASQVLAARQQIS